MAQNTNNIQYVQLMDVADFEENSEQCIQIDDDDSAAEMTEIITINDENHQIEEVEYIEAEELDENHTIIVHDGKQYVIPTDQLNQAGNTIILEENAENSPENSENITENDTEDNNIYFSEENSEISAQYAVLKDGKLHIRDQNSEMTEKLRDFEQSLNNFDSNDYENDDDEQENESSQEEDELLSQITGKNLLTGQTISLSGFLDKLKKKNLNTVNPKKQSQRSPNSNQIQGDFMLVPPVNRRVVVGRTPDGRKLIGRILQIQKKITPVEAAQLVPRRQNQKPKRHHHHHHHRISGEPTTPQILFSSENPPKYSPLLDDHVSRTLAGLMDLESVNRNLIGRKLIVRHLQRRSVRGKTMGASRKINYYSGKMRKNGETSWIFNADNPSDNLDKSGNAIDLNVSNNDPQQINMADTEPTSDPLDENVEDDEEDNGVPITLFLTVTQDEYGKKKTKVSIPQLGNNNSLKKLKNNDETNANILLNICQICNKKFQTAGSLRRHASIHDPNLRPLQCLQCLARFTDESSLKKHLVLHSGIRPHVCTICGKNFAHRGDLNFHNRTHNPVKQFKCDICAKTFHRHSNLIRHLDIHKQQTPVAKDITAEEAAAMEKQPPFVCETCGCQYNFVSSLTRHIVTHHLKNEESDEKMIE